MLKVILIALFVAVTHAQTGGFVPQTEVTDEVKQLASWAASSLSSNQQHTVLAIKNIQTQVVSGINYKFTLDLLVDNKLTKSCDMSIFVQSWSNTKKFNAEPECTEAVAINMGGFTPKPVNEEALSLAKWAAASFTNGEHSVVSVSNYRTQVVNGVNHKFTLELLVDGQVKKTCEMSIYTQSWTNTIRHFEQPRCSASRAGSFTPAEVDDKVKEIAAWSAVALSTVDSHSVIKIENVQKQVVNGINYKFTLTLAVNGVEVKTCEMSVFDQQWTGIRKFFATPRCSASRAVVGGFVASEVTKEVEELAAWYTASFSTSHSVAEIKNVQVQVVNGLKYKFTIVMNVAGQPSKSCEVAIFYQPWTGVRSHFETPRCSATRDARSLVGGFTPSEVTPKVEEIAAWSAAALSAVDEHKVVSIKNVQIQVVAGVNYKFTLELNVNGQVAKSCELSVFDQPWTNTRRFFEAPRCTAARGLVGGFVSHSVVSAEALEVAQWAASEYSAAQNAASNSVYPIQHTVMTVENLRTQVVNGINYKFTIKLRVSRPPSNAVTTKSCEMSVHVQPTTGIKSFFESPACF